jgi:hypothetical protein
MKAQQDFTSNDLAAKSTWIVTTHMNIIYNVLLITFYELGRAQHDKYILFVVHIFVSQNNTKVNVQRTLLWIFIGLLLAMFWAKWVGRSSAETENTLPCPITQGTEQNVDGAIISSPPRKLVYTVNKNWGGSPVNLFTTDFGFALNYYALGLIPTLRTWSVHHAHWATVYRWLG